MEKTLEVRELLADDGSGPLAMAPFKPSTEPGLNWLEKRLISGESWQGRDQRRKGLTIFAVDLEPMVQITEAVFPQDGVEDVSDVVGDLSRGDEVLVGDEGVLDGLTGADQALVLDVHDLTARVGALRGLGPRRAGEDGVHHGWSPTKTIDLCGR
jgi:hypothetical protein